MTTTKVFTPSPEQAVFLDWISNGTGSCVLEAVAGAGKTSTLMEGVKRMNGEVFLGAYNTKMAAELKGRLADMGLEAMGSNGKTAATFHSAGFSALRYALKATGFTVDDKGKKVMNIVNEMFADMNREPEAGEAGAICKLVSLAKQTGFFCRGLVEIVKPHYWVELINRHDVADGLSDDYDINTLVSLADAALKASNAQRTIIDFDDMCYLPLLMNLRFWKKDWVLIDEAQDTNSVRREIARRMLKPGTGRLVAVGDPHQAIFGFTGADNRSLDLIRQIFGAATMSLSVSWRCPQAVVAVARQYVDHIHAAPTALEGSVSAISYRQMVDTIQPGHAVLCRFNAPLVELCFRLIRAGKAAKIEGREIGKGLVDLVGRWKVKSLDAFETKLIKWDARERAKAGADEAKLARHEDKQATIVCLLERAREQGLQTVAEMQTMVSGMFADTALEGSAGQVILSSVHKSKGLEWPVVHILGRGEILPSPRAVQEWQQEQEINLAYVAVTRAQEALIDVPMPTPADLMKAAKKPVEEVAS
jgi:superfamily I DNA/RNA helicase